MKTLRATGFELAETRWKELRPLLEEFEEIETENKKQNEIKKSKEKSVKNKKK